MLQILGGEIGVERSDKSVDDKYGRLRDLNRRKSDVISPPANRPANGLPASQTFFKSEEALVRSKPQPGYIERVRMNFLAARPEHKIKTRRSAFMSLASIFTPVQDLVNPQFIVRGDDIFFRHIENLTLSVRGLLAINRQHAHHRLRNPFYIQVLTIIKNWDIEGLHQELTHLQIKPRNITIEYCSSLARRIYEPIVRLSQIDSRYFIAGALKRLYDLNMLSLPKKHPGVEQIKNYYHTAMGELEYIFKNLKYRFFPLLLKLSSEHCISFDLLFGNRRDEILEFLELSQDDVLTIPAEPESDQQKDEESSEELQTEVENNVLESPVIQKGLELLERMFPRAGWNRLHEFPDLLPYFKALITFPRGFELVPPEDPLHQVFVLAAILQELFYGFRSVEFDASVALYDGVSLRERFDGLAERWRLFIDDIIAQNYLNPLYSYCREIERSAQFASSAYGVNQENEMLWLKKRFLLPHLVLTRVKRTPTPDHELPRLHEITKELRELFTSVAAEIADPVEKGHMAVKNLTGQFEFEIENPVSRRFREVLRLYHEETTNANLLLCTFSILLVLDTLINDERSFFYPYVPEWLYRRESDDSRMPQYTVPKLNPQKIFLQTDREAPAFDEPPRTQKPETKDTLTNLANIFGLRQSIEREMAAYRSEKSPFTVLSVLVRDFMQYCETHGEDAGVELLQTAASIIKNTIRDFLDFPGRMENALFFVVLPGTAKADAVNLAIRLILLFTKAEGGPIPVSIGVVEFVQTWGKEKMLKLARQASEEAATVPPPSLSLYDGKSNSFSTHSDVHK